MADPLFELLAPYFDALDTPARPLATDPTTAAYLSRLTTLSLSDLTTNEPLSLSHSSQSQLRSLQALSKRSHKSIISAASQLSKLSSTLPLLYAGSSELRNVLPELESSAANFAEKYKRSSDVENEALARRKTALLLSQNADRISSVLDLPTLLSSAISSSQLTPGSVAAAGATSTNYASALDLHAHIKRLANLYAESPLINSIRAQSEREMKLLTTTLIGNLQSQNIKLAGAMRTIGWLQRVAPELDEQMQMRRSTAALGRGLGGGLAARNVGSGDGALGALFLVCRLAHLTNMLDALEPLRDLADQESQARVVSEKVAPPSSAGRRQSKAQVERAPGGQQTERYLKRYIEIFREQSFAIVSMYKSIFPAALPAPGSEGDVPLQVLPKAGSAPGSTVPEPANGLLPLPSPLATFPSHLVDMLFETLREYLPNVRERAARDSLLTQVLYCAGSLGRLGGDFSMMLALLEDSDDEGSDEAEEQEQERQLSEPEWVEVMKKHRVQASRLELLASGVGSGVSRKDSTASVPTT